MQQAKVIEIALSEVVRDVNGKIDVSLNVREPTEAGYDLEHLTTDIAERGLLTSPVLNKRQDGKYEILQGNRRMLAIESLGVTKVKAIVYNNLSDLDKINFILDHGNTKPLTKVEVLYAIKRAYEYGMTEEKMVKANRPLLEQYWPRSEAQRKNLHSDKDWLDSFKGVIQQFKRAFESPEIAYINYVKRIKGEQRWPNDDEIRNGVKVFKEECKTNLTYNRLNPGPLWLEHWEGVKNAGLARETGANAPKSGAMKTNTALLEIVKRNDSIFMKTAIMYALNKITDDQFNAALKIALEHEKNLPEKLKTDLLVILNVKSTPGAAVESEAKAE